MKTANLSITNDIARTHWRSFPPGPNLDALIAEILDQEGHHNYICCWSTSLDYAMSLFTDEEMDQVTLQYSPAGDIIYKHQYKYAASVVINGGVVGKGAAHTAAHAVCKAWLEWKFREE